jgi:glycosyltransferase involved in cell wall biosynthesis
MNIIGDGSARSALEEHARRLGLADRVHFHGWISRDHLAWHYRETRLTVVPSRWPEPFGMVGLEAMVFARPVVAFAVGGIPDWLAHERTGFAVPEQDVAAFARALERLLQNHALAETMGLAGRERAQTEFAFDKGLDRLEHLLIGTTSLPAHERSKRGNE